MDEDEEYTLTGYGELSAEAAFTLPPSPTQTIKYRYRAYRPKLARGLRTLTPPCRGDMSHPRICWRAPYNPCRKLCLHTFLQRT